MIVVRGLKYREVKNPRSSACSNRRRLADNLRLLLEKTAECGLQRFWRRVAAGLLTLFSWSLRATESRVEKTPQWKVLTGRERRTTWFPKRATELSNHSIAKSAGLL